MVVLRVGECRSKKGRARASAASVFDCVSRGAGLPADRSAAVRRIFGTATRGRVRLGAGLNCHSERSEEPVWRGGARMRIFRTAHPHRSLATLGMTLAKLPVEPLPRDVVNARPPPREHLP